MHDCVKTAADMTVWRLQQTWLCEDSSRHDCEDGSRHECVWRGQQTWVCMKRAADMSVSEEGSRHECVWRGQQTWVCVKRAADMSVCEDGSRHECVKRAADMSVWRGQQRGACMKTATDISVWRGQQRGACMKTATDMSVSDLFTLMLLAYFLQFLTSYYASTRRLLWLRFYHVGDFSSRVLLFVDVPFHVFTSGSPRPPFSYLAKDILACIRHVRW